MAKRERERGPASDRRGLFAFVAVAIAVALALLFWRGSETRSRDGGGDDDTGEEARDDDEIAREERARERERRERDRRAPIPDGGRPEPVHPSELPPILDDPQVPGPESDPETADPGPGAELIARYHGRSGRLSPQASVDGSQTSVPQRSRMAPPNVVVWVESRIGIPGEPLVIHAAVMGRQSELIDPDRIALTLFRSEPEDGFEVPMRRAEHDYQGTYTPTIEAHPVGEDGTPARVQLLVRATGTYDDEPYSRSVTSWFVVSVPNAHADFDRAQIAREGSDIVMRVPVHVAQPGNYYGYAELWGGGTGETPIAFARERVHLEMGDQVFTFLFGGGVIRERGIDGPYTVRNARFMGVDTVPPHEQRPVPVVTATPSWPASSFE